MLHKREYSESIVKYLYISFGIIIVILWNNYVNSIITVCYSRNNDLRGMGIFASVDTRIMT